MGIRAELPELDYWKARVACQMGCPVATDAGRYVQLIAEGRPEESYLVARSPNPFASVCGRVCAAPCEDACRRGRIDTPISIRALKRHVCEQYGIESPRPHTQDVLRHELVSEGNRYPGHLPVTANGGRPRRKVAVIGAGPAGMSAAHDLALLGHDVTVFEAAAEPGGMMRFGIPEYRLPRGLIRAEIDKILSFGVRLELGVPLTREFGLAALKKDGYEAVFLSVGVSRGRDLAIPGVELDGVIKAVDYLLNINRGYRVQLGRHVVVIGGGFVAFDAARTALRMTREQTAGALQELSGGHDQALTDALDSARAALRGGASDVTIVSLESFEEMPALRTRQGHDELEEAEKEGVHFLTRFGPKRFLGGKHLEAVELRRVLRVFDADGAFSPVYDDRDLTALPADACILAIGQRADLSFLDPADGVELTPGGTIKVDRATLATSAPGIYAGGDVAFGPRNLIDAVANGKLAAVSMHRFLTGSAPPVERQLEIQELPTRTYRRIAGYELLDREAPPALELDRRTGIAEVEVAYGGDAARAQGARCLLCHIQTIYDPEKCVLCNRCVDVCPEHCLALVPFEDLDLLDADRAALSARAGGGGLPLAAMVKDDTRCIRCGLCAIRCPTAAMTMERFTITERYASGGPAILPVPGLGPRPDGPDGLSAT